MIATQPVAGIRDYDLVRPELRKAELLYENIYREYPLYKKKIPVYSRRSYYAYLLGTSSQLFAIVHRNDPCTFSLDFDLYKFDHDDTGYEGTFPVAPTKAIRLSLQHTDVDDRYTGKMYEGATELGTVLRNGFRAIFERLI